MERISEVIIVEGRYDKNTLSQIVDATIIETNGFSVFSDSERLELIRRLGEKRGLIIFTDSDGAGFVIRGRLKGMLPGIDIKEAYTPDIFGKERRKRAPSKEGKLGVEGMERDVILDCLRRAGATFEGGEQARTGGNITKRDLYELGLSGAEDSAERRCELQKRFGLPEHLSANALTQVLNTLYTREELFSLLARDDGGGDKGEQ